MEAPGLLKISSALPVHKEQEAPIVAGASGHIELVDFFRGRIHCPSINLGLLFSAAWSHEYRWIELHGLPIEMGLCVCEYLHQDHRRVLRNRLYNSPGWDCRTKPNIASTIFALPMIGLEGTRWCCYRFHPNMLGLIPVVRHRRRLLTSAATHHPAHIGHEHGWLVPHLKRGLNNLQHWAIFHI